LKDKFGLSWQIVPTRMLELLSDKDKAKSGRAMEALMKMVKIDLQKIQDAFDGK
jgi:two-component system sensor histidine kinase QseC